MTLQLTDVVGFCRKLLAQSDAWISQSAVTICYKLFMFMSHTYKLLFDLAVVWCGRCGSPEQATEPQWTWKVLSWNVEVVEKSIWYRLGPLWAESC